MRILYVCTYYHRAMVFRDAMNYLEKRGAEIVAFNAVAKGAKVDDKYKAIMDDKVVHRECFNKYDRFFFFTKQRKIKNSIEKNVDVKSFDLIHSHTLFNGGWAVYKLYKKYGVPYVVSVRNTDLNVFMKIPVFKRIAKTVVENASGVLFLSKAYKEKFLNICFNGESRAAVEKKCDVIPNGLEPFWLENVSEPKKAVHDKLQLLCVGKIDKNKNLKTTIEVLKRLNEKGEAAHLTVIGQVLDEEVKALLDSSENVSVVSYLKKEQLIDYYRDSDVFIMPSFSETFGRVYAEAMTQAMPVIYTRGQGFDGMFEDGEVGFSVKADDVGEITAAVEKTVGDFANISANCVKNCGVFNWLDISERLEKLYSDSIKGVSK